MVIKETGECVKEITDNVKINQGRLTCSTFKVFS